MVYKHFDISLLRSLKCVLIMDTVKPFNLAALNISVLPFVDILAAF